MPASPQMSLAQANRAARQLVVSNSLEMLQKIFSTTIAAPGNTANVMNIPPKNVGLIKRFYAQVFATIAPTTGANTITLTALGPANLLSQVVYTDLSNYTRIQTAGWHIHFVQTAKLRNVYGAAATTDSPVKFGNNFSVITAPATITGAGGSTLQMIYEIPLAYTDDDLRGSVYANVLQATQNLQLTINPNPVAASGDAVLAVYSGNAGSILSATTTVYQEYLDQLPVGKNGVILPTLDLSTLYELKNTTLSALVAGQDFGVQYPNYRDFLSTFAIYDNNGTLNAGTDINYWALQSANLVNIFNITPAINALKTRKEIFDDFPSGVYYFSHRRRPINTSQYGNVQLVINPITAPAGANLLVGFEDLGLMNVITGAGSLPSS